MTPEQIYAVFTTVGALLVWLHVIRVYRDKQVRGVHWAPLLFTWVWCLYGCYFYAVSGMPWTWAANMLMFFSYSAWLAGVFRYWKNRT